jgi:arginine repressor
MAQSSNATVARDNQQLSIDSRYRMGVRLYRLSSGTQPAAEGRRKKVRETVVTVNYNQRVIYLFICMGFALGFTLGLALGSLGFALGPALACTLGNSFRTSRQYRWESA